MNPLVDKALQADQIAKNLKQEAIQALLKDRATIGDQLKALGHIEGQKPTTKTKEPKTDAQKHCKVCQMYGHDGRFHRRREEPTQKPASPKPPAPATAAK